MALCEKEVAKRGGTRKERNGFDFWNSEIKSWKKTLNISADGRWRTWKCPGERSRVGKIREKLQT